MKKRLMVVDDSRVMELQICKLLENSKYEVVAYCENGEEAIARYEEVQPDIVTMDIIMPGIDGLEAAQIIAEAHPDARIIMISSLAYEDTLQEAEAVGAKLFLYKPIDRENLLDALEQVMGEDGCQESCAEK